MTTPDANGEAWRALYAAGHTQRAIARMLKTSQKTVWAIVNDKTYNPLGEAA